MTENRYKLANPNNLFKNMNIGIIDNTRMLKLTDAVDRLNEQHEELIKLKKKKYSLVSDVKYYKKENNSLKKELNKLECNYNKLLIIIQKHLEYNSILDELGGLDD